MHWLRARANDLFQPTAATRSFATHKSVLTFDTVLAETRPQLADVERHLRAELQPTRKGRDAPNIDPDALDGLEDDTLAAIGLWLAAEQVVR